MFADRRLRAERSRLVGELFRSFLERDPEPEALSFYLAELESGYTLKDIVLQIQASPEYRKRSGPPPPAVTAPTAPDPAGEHGLDLQILIVTGDGLPKLVAQVALLKAALEPRDLISILDGSVGKLGDDGVLQPGRVELLRFPGNSVFHLRQKIPGIVRNARWIVLLEDHNEVGPDWIGRLHARLSSAGAGTTAVLGSFTNRFSRTPWSWANFLITFAPYWHPVRSEQRRMLPISNVAFARDLLPCDDFEFGAFENHFLPGLLSGAQLDDAIVIDHRQHCGFARATILQFHNARVAGACMRMTYPNAMAGLRRGLREFLFDRVPAVASIIALHPLKNEIPALTRLRMRWLTVAIAAGYLCGSCFGYGKSPWKLE